MADEPAPKQLGIGTELQQYLVDHGTPPDELLQELIDTTRERFGRVAGMQIDPVQGAFREMLVRLTRPAFVVEVGTFTGYSSICLARGLPERARLLCCDVSDEFTSVAREFWRHDGIDDRIELRLGPAVETLAALPDDPPVGRRRRHRGDPGVQQHAGGRRPDRGRDAPPRRRPDHGPQALTRAVASPAAQVRLANFSTCLVSPTSNKMSPSRMRVSGVA